MGVRAGGRTFRIGRASDCDIVIADESVSRHHAEVVFTDNRQLLLSDCRSTRGTEIVDRGVARRISREIVGLETTIRFGDVTMTGAELLQALEARHADAGAVGPPRIDRGDAAVPHALDGAPLVRCACGAIKTRNQRCPECGE